MQIYNENLYWCVIYYTNVTATINALVMNPGAARHLFGDMKAFLGNHLLFLERLARTPKNEHCRQ